MSGSYRRNGVIIGALVLTCLLGSPVGRASADVDEGLIAYWNFDECGGNIVHDQSGYGNDAVMSRASWHHCMWVPGCALEVTGTAIAEYIPSSCDDPIDTAFTIACWLHWFGPSQFPRSCYVFDCRGASGQARYGFILYVEQDGTPACLLFRPPAGEYQAIRGTTPVPIRDSTHIAVVFDDVADVLRLYVRGVETDVAPAPYPYYDSNLTPAIGNNLWAPGDQEWAPLNGRVDELRIYNRVLSVDEIDYLVHYGPYPSATDQGTWGAIKVLFQ